MTLVVFIEVVWHTTQQRVQKMLNYFMKRDHHWKLFPGNYVISMVNNDSTIKIIVQRYQGSNSVKYKIQS